MPYTSRYDGLVTSVHTLDELHLSGDAYTHMYISYIYIINRYISQEVCIYFKGVTRGTRSDETETVT